MCKALLIQRTGNRMILDCLLRARGSAWGIFFKQASWTREESQTIRKDLKRGLCKLKESRELLKIVNIRLVSTVDRGGGGSQLAGRKRESILQVSVATRTPTMGHFWNDRLDHRQ